MLRLLLAAALLSLTACDEKFAGRGLSGLVPRGAPACSEAGRPWRRALKRRYSSTRISG